MPSLHVYPTNWYCSPDDTFHCVECGGGTALVGSSRQDRHSHSNGIFQRRKHPCSKTDQLCYLPPSSPFYPPPPRDDGAGRLAISPAGRSLVPDITPSHLPESSSSVIHFIFSDCVSFTATLLSAFLFALTGFEPHLLPRREGGVRLTPGQDKRP